MRAGSTHSFSALDTLAIWGNPSPPVAGSSSTWNSKSSLISFIIGLVVPAYSDSVSSNSDRTPVPMPTPNPFRLAIIKDKPSNIGLKDIVNKDSWLDAKNVIGAGLCRSPYWPSPSKYLVTAVDNAPASAWQEEVIVYYYKPPMSDLFMEESRFDGKGFEMIAYINAHFNPSDAVDSLSYILDLIDIRQLANESVVTLKACFSWLFSSLKMGGITIGSALQVGFMLRALLAGYQAAVQEFCLGQHSLTLVSLQTVVGQCVLYNKDPWHGSVGCDSKQVCAPSANAAAVPTNKDSSNPYNALSTKPTTTISTTGRKFSLITRANVSYATTLLVIPTTKPEIAPF
jgi:hypothetical protein